MNNKSNAVAKVGIILGVILLIITAVIFIFANRAEEKKKQEDNTKTEIVETVKTEKNDSDTGVAVTSPIVEPEVIKEVETVIQSQITDINESSLGSPIKESEILVRIAKKGVLLLDSSPETSENKMLAYYFAVFGPNNEDLTLFMTKSAYDVYNVGDTLLVNYAVYKNANNIEFPIVLSVKDPNATVVEQNMGTDESPSE